MCKDFLSPSDLVEKYPNIPFDAQNLGRLLKMKLLKGKIKDKVSYISEDSLIELVKFRNEIVKDDIIYIEKKN